MRGIDKFKERFAGHDGEYVLIGGGACDLLFGEAGQDFRATKDLDLVLLVEALTPEFGQVFWDTPGDYFPGSVWDASLARRSVRSSPSYVKLAGINMGVGPADFRRGL